MAFKIKDAFNVGTFQVTNAVGELTTPKVKDTVGGTYNVTITPTTVANGGEAMSANRQLYLPNRSGTVALTTDLGGAVFDGTLTQTTSSAGATNTTVDLSFSATYSANTNTNTTLKTVVGPAISGLATIMTGATSGFLVKTAADTYSLDTSTYLTSSTGVSTISFGTTGLTPSTGTSGAITVAGTLATTNGGTGGNTAQLGMNNLAGAVTSGYYLRGSGTNVVMSAIQAGDVPTLNQNTSGTAALATNLSGGSAGAVVYQSATGVTAYLTAGTSSQVLVGGASNPSWSNTPTLTGTNFSGIPNGALSNSTISGVALGGTLSSLTAGAALVWSSGTTYNGSAAATLAVDSTTTGTPSAWASVTTGTVSIGSGLTTGTLNLAASGTGANTINIGNPNSSTVISGNWVVNGVTTTVNTSTLTVDDKNIELGTITPGVISTTGTVGTIGGSGPWTAVLTGMVTTSGLIVGSAITATDGSGSLGAGGTYVVTAINSPTSVNYTATGGTTPTAGTVTNVTGGSPSNISADGGGITLHGTTDKTIIWDNANGNWTSSEDWNLVTGKAYKINNVSVLNATTLGSAVVTSSLTTVGTVTSGTWSSSFGAVSGANLTNLTAGNLTGTIPSTVLGNSTLYVGTTSIALNRTSADQALTGILSVTFAGATSGTTQLIPSAIASGTLTMPAATGTLALTSDIPTVNAGTLGAAASTAGATNTGVETTFSGSWNANSASNVTIKNTVGPAIGALVSTMTGAGSGFLKKTAADTYSVDTTTYLSAEADTLQTVTTRGATTSTAVSITNATESTTTATGALIVDGGVAIKKNLTVAGDITIANTAGTKIAAERATQATVASVSPTVIDSWPIATYRSAKYVIQVTQSTGYQTSELIVIHDGSAATRTEYAVMEAGLIPGTNTISYTVAVNGANVELSTTNSSATSAVFNIVKTLILI